MRYGRLFWISILTASLMMLFFSNCASVQFSRAGQKYEQAGMFRLAVDQYLLSLDKNFAKNEDARIGLLRASKRYADELELKIKDAYSALNDDLVVRYFQELKTLQQRASIYRVDVDIPMQTIGQYEEASTRHLRKTYTLAVTLMNDNKFEESERLFSEVVKLNSSYERASEYLKYTRCEPLYRQGKKKMEALMYRSAYLDFTRLISMDQTYKDVLMLQREALYQAVLTIAFQPVFNGNQYPFLATNLEASVKGEFERSRNPFLKLVSLNYLQDMLAEQRRALAAGVPFDAGLILPVRVYLSANIINSHYSTSLSRPEEKKAYLQYVDKEDKVKYRKVTYNEYEQSCRANISVQFEYVRVSDGVMLAFDRVEQNYSDQVRYARSEFDYRMLFPGDWGGAAKDTMYTDQSRIRALRSMFETRQTLTDKKTFESQFAATAGAAIFKKINAYDPGN
jgi:hypothetical protein